MAVVEGATATLELPMMSRMRDLVHLVLKQSLAEDETNFSKFFFLNLSSKTFIFVFFLIL